MLNRVVVDVIKPGKVCPLISQQSFAVVVPHLPPYSIVEPVYPLGRFTVQLPEHDRKALCIGFIRGRMRNKVVVV